MRILVKLLTVLIVISCAMLFFVTLSRATAISPLDRYGRIRWDDEKARLDNFAIHLTMQPDLIGWFMVRAGTISCKGEAQAHAIRAKNYLMNVRQIPWNRIIWRDIGFGDDF